MVRRRKKKHWEFSQGCHITDKRCQKEWRDWAKTKSQYETMEAPDYTKRFIMFYYRMK